LNKVFINSLPKSGTNLVAKALDLMGYNHHSTIGAHLVRSRSLGGMARNILWPKFPSTHGYLVGIDSPVIISKRHIDKILSKAKNSQYSFGHVGYTSDFLLNICKQKFKPIIITRDPRAVAVSFVHFVKNDKRHHLHPMFKGMTHSDALEVCLNGITIGGFTLQPLNVRCDALRSWLYSPNVLHVKFENLVGESGGGSDDKQWAEINSICNHLGVSSDCVGFVAKNLFGAGRNTFRKGHVDSWRDEVPENISLLMNRHLVRLLIEWGYDD
jgi:hypothetical protein